MAQPHDGWEDLPDRTRAGAAPDDRLIDPAASSSATAPTGSTRLPPSLAVRVIVDPAIIDGREAGIQALTAAAAVTERIGLFSNLTIGPVHDRALLAKRAAGLDQIPNGRFVLGLATGWREGDSVVAGKPYAGRGNRLEADIESMRRAWRGELLEGATKKLTPTPTNGESVPLAFGGTAPAVFARAAGYGVGWTVAEASPDEVKGLFESARAA